MKQYVIIVAGGKGLRMGTTIPKQFLELNGKAIILHTLKKFRAALPQAELLLVLPDTELDRWKEIASNTPFHELKTASGGKTRFDSVRSGLQLIQKSGVVGIHDAVRPFVAEKVIQDCFETAEKKGTAIPVVKLKDSIRKLEGNGSSTVDRELFRIVQTPQCFKTELIKEAYQQNYRENFTDDASVVEENGTEVHLVDGNFENIKITTLEDLRIGEALLNH